MGLNEIGYESGNPFVHDMGRSLPWLQDTPQDGVWKAWDVRFRDLVILDGDNREVAVFNLSDRNLFDPDVRDEVRAALQQAARDALPTPQPQ